MYIKRLELKNLRSFEEAVVDFNAPGSEGLQYPNVNVFLGGNGLGKTTVLRAIALAILGPLMYAPVSARVKSSGICAASS